MMREVQKHLSAERPWPQACLCLAAAAQENSPPHSDERRRRARRRRARSQASTFFITLGVCRLVRFGSEALLAVIYGPQLLSWFDSDIFHQAFIPALN